MHEILDKLKCELEALSNSFKEIGCIVAAQLAQRDVSQICELVGNDFFTQVAQQRNSVNEDDARRTLGQYQLRTVVTSLFDQRDILMKKAGILARLSERAYNLTHESPLSYIKVSDPFGNCLDVLIQLTFQNR